jgi:hypothetical protein
MGDQSDVGWEKEAYATIAENPLLAEWQIASDGRTRGLPFEDHMRLREVGWEMQARYAYSTPTVEALTMIESCGRIIEICAGRGYWAKCLAERGVDIVATDSALPANGANDYWRKEMVGSIPLDQFFPTEEMSGTQAANSYSDRALMMVWPDPDSGMASDALSSYGGDIVIYVGEDAGGCTANEAFFDEILDTSRWTERAYAYLPSWPGTRDGITVYDRVK